MLLSKADAIRRGECKGPATRRRRRSRTPRPPCRPCDAAPVQRHGPQDRREVRREGCPQREGKADLYREMQALSAR
jgi:hypothetical protein